MVALGKKEKGFEANLRGGKTGIQDRKVQTETPQWAKDGMLR